jgi:hypothetical protein
MTRMSKNMDWTVGALIQISLRGQDILRQYIRRYTIYLNYSEHWESQVTIKAMRDLRAID